MRRCSCSNGLQAMLAMTAVLLLCRTAQAASGSWTGSADASWTNAANWSAAPFPGAVSGETATFDGAGNGNTVLDLTGLASILNMSFTTAGVAAYTVGAGGANGQTLVMESGGLFQQGSTVANAQTFDAAVQLGPDTSAGSYLFGNDSTSRLLTFAGNVGGGANGGTPGLKTLNVSGAGGTLLSGVLSDGGAGQLEVISASSRTNILSGANTFSGNVTINAAGSLSVEKIGNQGSADSNLGSGTTVFFGASNARLIYTGAGETSDRILMPSMSGTGTAIIDHQGTGPLVLTGDITATAAGYKQIRLQGGNNAIGCVTGVIAGAINDFGTSTSNNVYKTGTNAWTLAGNSTFRGRVEVNDGILRVTHSNALGIGPKTVQIANNANNANPTLHLDGSGGDLVFASNITFQTSNQRLGAIINVAGNNTILGNISMSTGDGATHIWSSGGKLTIAGNITPAATSRTLAFRGDGSGEVSGIIANGSTTTGLPVYRDTGAGTWTFSGANTYTGVTTVSAGALAIAGANGSISASAGVSVSGGATLIITNAAAANHPNRLNDGAPVTINDGAFVFANDGSASAFVETNGTLVLAGGQITVAASPAAEGGTSLLAFAGLSRTGSATVNFAGAGLGQSDRNRIFIGGQADGPLGAWATVNGTAPALYSSTAGVYAAATANVAAKGDTIMSDAGSSVVIATEGTSGPDELSDTVTAVKSLTQNTVYASTLNTSNKTFQASAVAIAAGMADLTLGAAPNGGTVMALDAGGDLTLGNYGTNALTVNAVIADNASPSSLTKYGTGAVVLAGSNTFSGAVTVGQGAVTLADSLALQNATLVTGGVAFDSAVATHAFTLGNLTNAFSQLLTDDAANPVTLSVGNNNASSLFGGALSGSGSLKKIGDGTLTLTTASTHSGGTAVSGGTLVAGQAGALGSGPVVSDSVLSLTAGAVTYTGLSVSLAGTGTVNVALGTTSSTTYLNGDYSAFTGIWNLGYTGTGGKAQMNGADHAAATVNVLTNATLYVSQPVPHGATVYLYGGDAGEANGQMRLDSNAEWAGPVKLAGDFTDASDGFFGSGSGTGFVSGVVSDIGGAHAVAKVGGARLYMTGTANTYAGQTSVRQGSLGAVSLKNVGVASSLGQPANLVDGTIKIGTGGTAGRLSYIGTGDTTDRVLELGCTNGSTYLEQEGSGTITFTSDLAYSDVANKTLVLEGSSDGMGELAGVYANNGSAVNKLVKRGTGRWSLSGINTYSGETEIQNGTLALAHPNAVAANSMVRFTTTRYGKLEFANDGASETEMNVTIGVDVDGTLLSGVGTGSAGINHTLNDLSLSRVTLTVSRASSVLSGSPSITARTLNLSGGNTYTTTMYPTDADLHIGAAAILANSYAKTLRLDGLSAGNTVTGMIYNGLNTLSLYKANASTWTLSGSNVYSGATTVSGGTLVLAGSAGSINSNGTVTVSSGATLRLSNTAGANNGNRLKDVAPISMSGGTFDYAHTAGSADYGETIGAVTLSGTGNSFMTSQADSGRTSALTLASLYRSAGATVDFSGAGLGADTRNRVMINGQPEGLIGFWGTYNGGNPAAYSSTLGICAAYTSVSNIAARGPSTIPDNALANASITTAGTEGPIALEGASVSSIAVLQQSTGTDAVVDASNKTFRAHGLTINAGQAALTIGATAGSGTLTALAAGGKLDLDNSSSSPLTVNSALADNGSASSLAKSGSGDVVVKGSTGYTGPTTVYEGSLNFGGHEFAQTLVGVISGGGTLIKSGTNTLNLKAANTYTGPTYINEGIVRPDQNAAFGTSAGGVFIASGATLDVGCTPDVGGTRGTNDIDLGSETFTVSGAGVGGGGAIVNNSLVSQYKAFGRITLATNATFGGTQRWDLRQNTPALTLNGYTLTKVGPNMVGLTGANVYPAEGQIDVQQGTLRLETSTKLNGGPTNVLTIRNGARFELYNVSSSQGWNLVLDSGSTFDAANNSDASTRNRWAGPILLNGAVTLTGGSGYVGNLLGDVTGTGSINKTGSANITISGTNNTYTGSTTISAGTLSVSNLCSVGVACSLGIPANAADGTIKIGSSTTSATLTYLGLGDTTDRILDMAGTTGGATVNQSGQGLLKFTNNVATSGSGTKTLTLGGSTSGIGEIAGSIQNSAGGKTAVTKSGSGKWTLSGNNSFTGDVNIAAGMLTISGMTDQGLGAINVGSSVGNATLRLVPGSQLTSSGASRGAGGLRIGNVSGAHSALYMTGGTVSRTPGTGDDLAFTMGRSAGSYGYFNMSGGDMTITRIQTGLSGTTSTSNTVGNVRMTGGALTLRDYILIARGVGSQSAFTVEGGTIYHTNTSERLSIGYEGGRGELNITGGQLISSTNLTVRQSANNSTGVVNICAGSLSVNLFQNTAPGVAWLNFAGGTLKAGTVDSTVFIPTSMNGVYSYGPYSGFAGGANIDTMGKNVTIAAPLRAPTGQGVYAITLSDKGSGYIGEPYVNIAEGGGVGATAIANMEDDETGNGTYRVASITVTCPGNDYAVAPTVNFRGGGTTAVTPTVGSVTLADTASGGLAKLGNGVLTLGAANTYTGATTVSSGTLRLGHALAIPTGSAVVLAGGTLDLGGYTATNAVSGNGVISNGTVRTVLSPAGAGTVGAETLTLLSASLVGTYLADVAASGASDLLVIQGNANLSGLSLELVDPNQLDRTKIYTIGTVTGTRTGAFTPVNLPNSRWHVLYGVDGSVKLRYTTGSVVLLK